MINQNGYSEDAQRLKEINKPISLHINITVEGREEIKSSEVIIYTAVVNIDTNKIARDFLNNRVLPVVEDYGLSG